MKLRGTVLDSGNAEELSNFYQNLLGWKKKVYHMDDKYIIVYSDKNETTSLVFQEIPNYKRPVWPSEDEKQQPMAHLDFFVKMDELDKEIAHAISCGARLADNQFSSDWTVMIDPAGHPFCLIVMH
ncbi:hypothetical protein KTC96_24125 (plasmid) [Clostridium estertheticum]|uniref:VOC family protein n=1 Tax=Clostridium estertheticum TaxID=238834 RepID=UPI001C7D6BE0|nr:VOC family protein [Clostridium estertheticum]MBX4262856.1 hypothetical protein [Clostridium estertheticum]WLC73211.1 hypothetical protein KTC96_24125 [Clostridium estertheticum]